MVSETIQIKLYHCLRNSIMCTNFEKKKLRAFFIAKWAIGCTYAISVFQSSLLSF